MMKVSKTCRYFFMSKVLELVTLVAKVQKKSNVQEHEADFLAHYSYIRRFALVYGLILC